MKIIGLLAFIFAISIDSEAQRQKHYTRVGFDEVGQSKFDTLEFKAKVKSIYECPPCP